MSKSNNISFASGERDFSITLNRRVNEYFKTNNLNRYANNEMIVKSFIMFSLFFIPYGLVVTELVTSLIWLLLLVVIMGLGIAGIGLSVMHDANHGAYSNKSWVNIIIGYSINMVGANSFNWKIQHNVLHHTFTNIYEADEDISQHGVLRLSPDSKWKKIHKYQFIYAWFLYGLMTIVWVTIQDFVRMLRYSKNGLAKRNHANIPKEWVILILSKILYVVYIFIVPLLFTSLLWWQILIGILVMHYIAGFILAIVFQPAHVIEGTEYPSLNEKNIIEYNRAAHQLHTTTNFSNNSKLFSWYIGGLNFQIEHHLFPNICHVHYRKISKIVRTTAVEFGLPYKSVRTFIGALQGHLQLLKKLGSKPI